MVALDAAARAVLDENRYVGLGTAGADGRPWVSPVFYTLSGYREVIWMSSPEARHSRNLAERAEVSLVVFDSNVDVGGAFAVYMCGAAAEVTGEAVAAVAAAYGDAALPKGGRRVKIDEVTGDGIYRMYRATVREHWVLDPDSHPDSRTVVTLVNPALSRPRCHVRAVTSALSRPRCHVRAVTSALSRPRCHVRAVTLGPRGHVRAAAARRARMSSTEAAGSVIGNWTSRIRPAGSTSRVSRLRRSTPAVRNVGRSRPAARALSWSDRSENGRLACATNAASWSGR